jgi:hypothetical protein
MRPRYGDDRERIACRKRCAPPLALWPKMEAKGILFEGFSMSATTSGTARNA